MTQPPRGPATRLARKLDVRDAVVIGLGAMVGAGIFAALYAESGGTCSRPQAAEPVPGLRRLRCSPARRCSLRARARTQSGRAHNTCDDPPAVSAEASRRSATKER